MELLLCPTAVIVFRKKMQGRICRTLTYSKGNKYLCKIDAILDHVWCCIEVFTFSPLIS